ncbi:MAG TPA: 7TM diverse intracellular signaling domain-containing protein [Anditalea sp.]|nr:7TM diverse intracellular signaling domain-containing protein [Anditalea sp.]
MSKYLIIFIHFCLFLTVINESTAQRVSGASTLKINDALEERIFSISQLEFYEDKTNSLEFADIIKPNFQDKFKINPTFSKSYFNTDYTYWVKLSLEKNPSSQKQWIMEFYDQTIDRIELHAPDSENNYSMTLMGDAYNFGQRNFKHKNFEIVLENSSEGISNYYIKINSSQKADIRIAIRSLNRFIYYALNEYFIYGIFYGMILIIALYNILVYFAVREIKYLYYTFYLASVGIYAMSIDGIAFQYLWPNYPEWNQVANGIFSYSIVVWAMLFSMKFLSTKTRAPYMHYILQLILVAKTCLFMYGLFWQPSFLEIKYYDVIPFFFVFFASIYIWTRGYKVVRFFVIAYGVLFVGMGIKILTNAAIIQHYTLIYYSLHIGFLIEMLLLTFALGDRIRILKDNRDRALKRSLNQIKINYELKDKVNKELENKVKKRTIELEQKNHLLESFNAQLLEKDEEIKRINSLLDRDNWKLKSSIKQSFQARLDNDSLSYEEFIKIFPDSSACYRYLEDLKWSKKFECRSCRHIKSSKGPKLFSKRCSKCGYIESVTAGTVFHGVKFPLEKAFYIVYIIISKNQILTLEQLAQILDLRKNTVWSFRKKINGIFADKGLKTLQWKDVLVEISPVKHTT